MTIIRLYPYFHTIEAMMYVLGNVILQSGRHVGLSVDMGLAAAAIVALVDGFLDHTGGGAGAADAKCTPALLTACFVAKIGKGTRQEIP